MMKIKQIFIIVLFFVACSKKSNNPFDDPALQPPSEKEEIVDADPNSIVGLHYNVFKPTCSNSGCHDGTFEPDFRTIESTYNSLIFHPIVKNAPDNSYTYRVVPGSADESVLYQRLIKDIDGQSGIMPLSVDPGSDWNEKKDQYLQNIKTWIENGAPDIFGNTSTVANIVPSVQGITAYANSNQNTLPRGPGNGALQVDSGTTSLEIWVSLKDEETAPQDFTLAQIKFYESLNGFAQAAAEDLILAGPVTEKGYFGDDVQFHHKMNKDVSGYQPGTTVFMRMYLVDNSGDTTEIPNDGSASYMKRYFAFEIK